MSRRAAVAAVAALAVLGGCSHKGADAPQPSSSASPSATASTASAQDLMTQPWPSYKADEGQTMEPEVASSAAPITLPPSKSMSKAGVATGFPRTAEGALAQLNAMDKTATKGLSHTTARAVFAENFEPGNPGFYATGWVGNLINAFESKNDAAPGTVSAEYTPQQGLIRGTAEDGNFAYVCVLGKLQITGPYNSQVLPYPDCQAMRWHDDRWLAVPHDSVAAPQVSPHSAEAYRLGFRDLDGA